MLGVLQMDVSSKRLYSFYGQVLQRSHQQRRRGLEPPQVTLECLSRDSLQANKTVQLRSCCLIGDILGGAGEDAHLAEILYQTGVGRLRRTQDAWQGSEQAAAVAMKRLGVDQPTWCASLPAQPCQWQFVVHVRSSHRQPPS
jgi:hypothetical protein